MIKSILQQIATNFFNERDIQEFANNSFIKNTTKSIKNIKLNENIITKAGFGQGVWAELPWIAFLNKGITTTPQQGYYIAYLFSGDGKKIFLTIALGVTNTKGLKQLKKDKSILINNLDKEFISKDTLICKNKINLKAQKGTAKKYEYSVVCYKEYDVSNLPSDNTIEKDLNDFVNIYDTMYMNINNVCNVMNSIKGKAKNEEIVHSNKDESFFTASEYKKRINHFTYEGRLKRKDVKEIKKQLGYTCEACGFNFGKTYPGIGDNFIEAHHKIPYAQLKQNDSRVLNPSDFLVLCSNCHKMIHKLDNPADIDLFKKIMR